MMEYWNSGIMDSKRGKKSFVYSFKPIIPPSVRVGKIFLQQESLVRQYSITPIAERSGAKF